MSRTARGQFVLVAAALLAVALAPVVLAYLQLGYHPDVAAADGGRPGADALRALETAVHEAGTGAPPNHTWSERTAAVDGVRSRLSGRLATIESARVESGVARRIGYNATAAAAWAARNCPGGPGRAFGDCEVDRSVVVQERAGRTHVLAVGLDLRVVTADRRANLTTVVRTVGGRASG